MKRTCNSTSDTNFKVIMEPHYLSERQNENRIKRLSKKIAQCIASEKKDRLDRQGEYDGIINKDYDEIFGIA